MKAKSREEFEQVWTEYVNGLGNLYYSVPERDKPTLKKAIKDLKFIVQMAAENIYGEKQE